MNGVELLGQFKTVGSKKQSHQVNDLNLSVDTGVGPCVFGMLETGSRCRSPSKVQCKMNFDYA